MLIMKSYMNIPMISFHSLHPYISNRLKFSPIQKFYSLKGLFHHSGFWVCVMFYRQFFIEKLGILIIFLYTTNQHQKYDIFYVEHFFQNSKLTLDRAHRDYRALVQQERGQEKNIKNCVTMLVDIKLYVYCNS